MKQAIISLFLVGILVMIPVSFMALSQNTPAQATTPQAAPALVNCTDVTIGQQVRIRCTAAGVVVLNTTVNLPQVEVTVPGAPVTVRVPLPGETQTVRVPGPTATVTVEEGNSEPQATVTITEPAEPASTVTVRPGQPVPTVTETTTVTPAPRQDATEPATIDPTPDEKDDDSVVTIPETKLSPPEAVGIGTLAILFVALLILLGMYAGYYMGYKDSDKAEAKFYKSLLGK